MPPMAYYSNVAGPNAPAVDVAFDISATVLSTLTTASQFSPLPFLQEASFVALAILNTVRGAKDNKEAFRSLANDACDLVSAIICVYNDMEKDGLKPSLGLKKRVEDLIVLLKGINHFAEKHADTSTWHRMVRLGTETQKIQQYRGRLRQALDAFGLQSSISIHETVVEILKEIREREPQNNRGDSESSSSNPPPSDAPYANLLRGKVTGPISITHIVGNHETSSTSYNINTVNSHNNLNFSSSSGGQQEHGY